MVATYEFIPSEFKAWSGAVDTLKTIISEGKEDEFNDLCENIFTDEVNETEFNDWLWFESDDIFKMLGIEVEE